MSRAAGLLLTMPAAVTILFILIVGLVERRNIFRPDAEAIASHVLSTRLGHVAGIVGIISGLAGFALFTSLLRRSGSDVAASIALVLFAMTTVLFVIDLTVRASVGVWAAEQTVAIGAEPEAWPVVVRWINANANVYLTAGFVATAIYGFAILETGILSSWVGWLAIIWSAAWLLLSAFVGGGIPAHCQSCRSSSGS